jgi:hypothetical protein
MSCNDGLQVTPEECEMIASMLTAEAFDENCMGVVPPAVLAFHSQRMFIRGPLGSYAYKDEDKEFFLSYAAFCKKASKYGGYYVY